MLYGNNQKVSKASLLASNESCDQVISSENSKWANFV